MLPNGDFDSEAYEDEKDWNMEDDSDGDQGEGRSRRIDKRGVSSEEVKLIQEENNGKKVRRVDLASS